MIQIISGQHGNAYTQFFRGTRAKRMRQTVITIGSVIVAVISLSLLATEKHNQHSPGTDHSAVTSSGVKPNEGGQATFSALVEIVALLEQDPETDWRKVNIGVLRAHLLDMNDLALETQATTLMVGPTQIRFDVRGTAESLPAIHRMVPAHSRYLEQSRNWSIAVELGNNGAAVTITADDSATLEKLSALGFYGFMSLDSHHQAHHYEMAMGRSH